MKPQPPRPRRLLLLLALSLVASGGVVARAQGANTQTQTSPPPIQSPAPAPAQTPAPPAPPLVKVDVIVTDESNRFVADLRQEDFRIEEDGAARSITFFAQEALPLSYSLLVDNTGSLRTMFERVLKTGETIVAGKGAQDEMSVVRFVSRDRIELMQDFTRNRHALVAALDEMHVEGGTTALTEALYVAAEAVVARAPGEARRRALVVITDGGERDPRANLDELLKYLRRHQVEVFVFGLTEAMSGDAFEQVKGGRRKSRELLDTLARETGGLAVFPKKPAEFDAAALALNARLRMPRYTLGYVSPADASNKPSKIKIKLADSVLNDAGKLHTDFRVRGATAEATAPARK
ncbi:MAG TPA: VWA domain-containing protein [Pyrinomonadaceae bacterium]|nr:VWA domain-containing protein [Pyrinomonadaceae bacterium]